MAGRDRRGKEIPPWMRRDALIFFLVGVGLLLLAVFGPVLWGERFNAGLLTTPALGLVGVAVYVLVGVRMPTINWAEVAARVLAALLKAGDKGPGGDEGAGDA